MSPDDHDRLRAMLARDELETAVDEMLARTRGTAPHDRVIGLAGRIAAATRATTDGLPAEARTVLRASALAILADIFAVLARQAGSHADAPQDERLAILYLASSPPGTTDLALDEEARAIREELVRTRHRDRFVLETRWAVQPMDLLRELRATRPAIVHVSAHGNARGPVFHGAAGEAQRVSAGVLGQTLEAIGAPVRVIVLAACHTDGQAKLLARRVDCAIGMAGAVATEVARAFAVGFYGALGDGASVGMAFRQGRAAIALLQDVAEPDEPRLVVREGVDADAVFVAGR